MSIHTLESGMRFHDIYPMFISLYSSLPYFEQQDISIGNFSYATGQNITESIQMHLANYSFGFEGVSVSV